MLAVGHFLSLSFYLLKKKCSSYFLLFYEKKKSGKKLKGEISCFFS